MYLSCASPCLACAVANSLQCGPCTLRHVVLLQMTTVIGQLPGQQIDDYLSMLSTDADAADGHARPKGDAEMQTISLI